MMRSGVSYGLSGKEMARRWLSILVVLVALSLFSRAFPSLAQQAPRPGERPIPGYLSGTSPSPSSPAPPPSPTPASASAEAERPATALIAFALTERAGLYVVKADGTGNRRVTLGSFSCPLWLPDGSAILSWSPDQKGFVEIGPSGDVQPLPPLPFACNPSRSPDGKSLAFTQGEFFNKTINILKSAADGSGAQRLTSDGRSSNPQWSPDGTLIAFQRSAESGPESEVMVMSPDGSNVTRLAEGGAPAWSPDGQRLAMIFSESGGAGTELRIIGPDGQGLQTVLKQAHMTKVAWSPDGGYLLYTFFKPDQKPDRFVEQFGIVRVDGSGAKELSQPDERHIDPQWSPSGGQILYTVTVGSDYDKRELWMTDLNSRAQQLTRLQDGSIFDATWSPSLPEAVMARWLPESPPVPPPPGITAPPGGEAGQPTASVRPLPPSPSERPSVGSPPPTPPEDRLKAVEARLQAVEEARLQAEAEAQRKAEEEARLNAKAEARRLATLAFQQGLTFASSGRIDESIQEFSAAIERDPTYAIAYANRGVAYLTQKKYNKALDDLKQAVALNPKDPHAFYNLAVLYTLRKEFDLAIDTLDQALTHGFNNYDALRHDPDLAGLRKQSEFRKLLDRHKIFR